jgi:hypothetical protein
MAYTTLAAVRLELGSGYATDDALLDTYIAQVKALIDTSVGFGFEASIDTTKYLDARAGGRRLALPYPLAAVTTVLNGNAVAVLPASYFTEPVNETPYRALTLYGSTGLYWTYNTDPEKAIAITGKWAWSVTAPLDIVRAATRMVAYWYRLKDAQVFDVTANPETGQLTIPKGMPVDVKPILDGYRRRWMSG